MDVNDAYLVLTFIGETRILGLNDEDELDEAEIPGFDSNSQVGLISFLDFPVCCELITIYSTWFCSLHYRHFGVASWLMTSLCK